MKKQLLSNLIFGILFVAGTILSSCEKIPGHSVVPSGGTTGSTGSGSSGGTGGSGGSGGSGGGSTMVPGGGSGPIAIGATNTVIFRINNDTTYTWTANDYNIQIVTVGAPLNLTHPIVSAKSGLGGLNDFQIMYYSLAPGTQNSNVNITLDLLSGNKYLTGTEKVTVTTEAMQNNVLVLKGTFDGYGYINGYASDSVRVAGSFNLIQP